MKCKMFGGVTFYLFITFNFNAIFYVNNASVDENHFNSVSMTVKKDTFSLTSFEYLVSI